MTATITVDNMQDILDSRDILARIAELDRIVCDGTIDCPYHGDDDCEMGDDGEADELAALQALETEASASPDWQYGEALIRDSYFEEYAREFAEDIGAIQSDLANRWPYTCIDWKGAAEELQADYRDVNFDGVTYWIRA